MRASILATSLATALVVSVSAAQATGSQTIHITSVTVSMVTHDIGPKGASKGDTITYADRLLNAAVQFGKTKGTRVGSDSGKLTFTSANTARFDGRATLPGGTLTLRGTVIGLTNGGLLIPVVGGTGAFAHVKGTLVVGTGDKRVANTYRLTRAALPVA